MQRCRDEGREGGGRRDQGLEDKEKEGRKEGEGRGKGKGEEEGENTLSFAMWHVCLFVNGFSVLITKHPFLFLTCSLIVSPFPRDLPAQ